MLKASPCLLLAVFLLTAEVHAARPVATPRPSAEALIEAGRHKYEAGDVAGAVEQFDRAVAVDPKEPRCYFARGIARSKQGDVEAALADYDRAIELNPLFAAAYTNRGTIYWKRGDLKSALADYDRAIDADPAMVQALNARGVIKDALGDRIGARTDYDRALGINPDFVASYGNRAQSFYLSRDWAAALADFRRAFTHNIPQQDYLRLFAWLCRARQDEQKQADYDLSAYLARRQGDANDWFSTLASFLLGKKTEREVTDAAGDPAKEAQKWCEAWFYLGMKALLAGKEETAAQDFHHCLDTGARLASEYLFAEAELKQLEK